MAHSEAADVAIELHPISILRLNPISDVNLEYFIHGDMLSNVPSATTSRSSPAYFLCRACYHLTLSLTGPYQVHCAFGVSIVTSPQPHCDGRGRSCIRLY